MFEKKQNRKACDSLQYCSDEESFDMIDKFLQFWI